MTFDFPFRLVFLILAGCKGKSVAGKNILERSKSNETPSWGVKYDTRLFGMMDIEKVVRFKDLISISQSDY